MPVVDLSSRGPGIVLPGLPGSLRRRAADGLYVMDNVMDYVMMDNSNRNNYKKRALARGGVDDGDDVLVDATEVLRLFLFRCVFR